MRRWAVGVWLGLVVVGGAGTLWLQDSGEPPQRMEWVKTTPLPTPSDSPCPPDETCLHEATAYVIP